MGTGADGGKNPDLEPAVNGYLAFENGVKGFYVGGHKKTSAGIKMTLEVVGSAFPVNIDLTNPCNLALFWVYW